MFAYCILQVLLPLQTFTSTLFNLAFAMESASSSRATKASRDTKLKTKGRGHTEINEEGKYDGRDGVFESIGRGGGGDGGPLQCEFLTIELSEGATKQLVLTSPHRAFNSKSCIASRHHFNSNVLNHPCESLHYFFYASLLLCGA